MEVFRRKNTRHKRIAAIGMYDGVHRGHRFLIDFLKREAEQRSLTPTVVTFNEHPMALVHPLEAPRLLTSTDERLLLLSRYGVKDVVLLNFNKSMRHLSAKAFLSMLRERYGVEALVVGFNNRFGHNRKEGIEQYRAIGNKLGVEIIEAPEYTGVGGHISSSIIRKHLADGNLQEAERALGHPYTFRATVVEGSHMGRTIDFPTANLKPENELQQLPKEGVYAVVVTTPDGIRRAGIMNIGSRPTVNDQPDSPVTLEVHILDYKGYLYGEDLEVEFIDRIRDEKKFPSLAKLKQQLVKDAAKAREAIKG